MSNPVLELEYNYSSDDEAALEPALSSLEKEVGGRRHPWPRRAGTIDLVTFLELAVMFVMSATLGAAVKSYFAGLVGAEKAKRLGERHQQAILQWLDSVQEALGRIVTSAKRRLAEGLVSPRFGGKEQPIAIRMRLGPIECFIVPNGIHVSNDALDRLPSAVIRMLRFIADVGLPEDSTVLQLCVDPMSGEWQYLLVPSINAFGRFVDRAIDLSTGRLITIRSAQEFIERFGVTEPDGIKFLVDPYRDTNVG